MGLEHAGEYQYQPPQPSDELGIARAKKLRQQEIWAVNDVLGRDPAYSYQTNLPEQTGQEAQVIPLRSGLKAARITRILRRL